MATNSPPSFISATIGQKILMAVSGLVIIGFVTVHLIGNLQIFAGPQKLNAYAETLQNLGAIKWGFRSFMVLFFIIHIWKGLVLWWENNKARPVAYAKVTAERTTIFSKTMIYTGSMIFLFVIYHLYHFTISPVHPAGQIDAYNMIVRGFMQPVIAVVYIVAMLLMSFHLSHAVSSMFQTFGLNKASIEPKLKLIANLYATVIFLGYVSIPLSVWFGYITLSGGNH